MIRIFDFIWIWRVQIWFFRQKTSSFSSSWSLPRASSAGTFSSGSLLIPLPGFKSNLFCWISKGYYCQNLSVNGLNKTKDDETKKVRIFSTRIQIRRSNCSEIFFIGIKRPRQHLLERFKRLLYACAWP